MKSASCEGSQHLQEGTCVMQEITFLPKDDWGFPLVNIKHIRTWIIAKICKNAAFFPI